MKDLVRLIILIFAVSVTTACKKDEPQSGSDPSENYMVYEGNYGSIGTAGGEITVTHTSSEIEGANIYIPEGSLTTTEKIKIFSGDNFYINGSEINVVGFGPSGLKFEKPVIIGVPISEGSYTNANVYYFNNQHYTFNELELVEVDKENNIAYAYTDHFSGFFAFNEEIDISEYVGTFIDSRDNIEYKWVKIGEQIWMAENLAYLPAVSLPSVQSIAEPHYYVYGYEGSNDSVAKLTVNYKTYGVLYNWTASMAGEESSKDNPSGVQGVCPSGWHLPSEDEWSELLDYLGVESFPADKLKEIGTIHWNLDRGSTNESGFTALPGGTFYYNNNIGSFMHIGDNGYWMSSTLNYNRDHVYMLSINTGQSLYIGVSSLNGGGSVRCIKD